MLGALFSSFMLLSASIAWAVAIARSPEWASSSAVVFGIGVIAMATVAIVGMVVGASRWALRLGIATSVALIVLGLVVPLDVGAVAGIGLASVALAGLAGTAMRGMIRQRPSADGPPSRAVLLGIVLLVSPPVWAFVTRDGLDATAVAAVVATWSAMIVYLKATSISLVTARFGVPVVLGTLAVFSSVPAGALIALTAVTAASLAWTVDARIAVQPLAQPGSTVPIPPELVPREILDAAGIDDRGRRSGGDVR